MHFPYAYQLLRECRSNCCMEKEKSSSRFPQASASHLLHFSLGYPNILEHKASSHSKLPTFATWKEGKKSINPSNHIAINGRDDEKQRRIAQNTIPEMWPLYSSVKHKKPKQYLLYLVGTNSFLEQKSGCFLPLILLHSRMMSFPAKKNHSNCQWIGQQKRSANIWLSLLQDPQIMLFVEM